MKAYYYSVTECRAKVMALTAKPAKMDIEKEKEKLKAQTLYDESMSFSKFVYFLRAPVLVFQTEYPMRESFRPGYFIKKAIQTALQLVSPTRSEE
ncbi:MAG: hypothetical protein P4M11_08475 [Candidatus Pacebacteria bacterium]|nr:hypothetical protein [Candidatus Paceibacterota bacterium]